MWSPRKIHSQAGHHKHRECTNPTLPIMQNDRAGQKSSCTANWNRQKIRIIVTAALIQNFRGKTQNATVRMQTCGGARCGVEAAAHTMSGLFDDSTTECIIFVDADRAFNRLNRQAALHNISVICPENSTFLKNVYKIPTPFYVKQQVIMSREGTTQGDVAEMQMYSFATKPTV